MSENIEKGLETLNKIDKKIEVFSEILDGLTSTEDKKKLLWKECYENALQERQNARRRVEESWSNIILVGASLSSISVYHCLSLVCLVGQTAHASDS